MDSGVLLDLLGNENRRRILRLLSRKPCYVTEISEYLGVSPKAVIDHLRKLEEAGMIESRTDDRRRKYFHIARNVRLEVSVSPYDFGTKSAYAASSSLDMNGQCPHLTIELPEGGGEDVSDLAAEFARLRDLEHELSVAQRWLHGRMTETLEELNDRIGVEADSRFFADLLAAVASTDGTTPAIAEEVSEPREAVEQGLQRLADAGLLVRTRNGWRFTRG